MIEKITNLMQELGIVKTKTSSYQDFLKAEIKRTSELAAQNLVTDTNGVVWTKKQWEAPDGKLVEYLEAEIMGLLKIEKVERDIFLESDYAPMETPDVWVVTLSRWPKHTKVRAYHASWHDTGEDWQTQKAKRGYMYDYDGDGPTPLAPSVEEKAELCNFPNWRIDKDWKAVLSDISEAFIQWYLEDRKPWSEAYKKQEQEAQKKAEEREAKKKARRSNRGYSRAYYDSFYGENWSDLMDEPF